MLPLRDRLPCRIVPFVNYGIVGANVAVFFWERAVLAEGVSPLRFLRQWGLVPALLSRDPWGHATSVVTSMFLHDPTAFMHLGSNMLFLWIFGDNVEDALGHARYVAFYLLCGLAAALAQFVADPGSPIPMVGASGAIAGVLAAYGILYPRSPITVLNPILPLWLLFGPFFLLPAWIIILEFFVINLLNALSAAGASGGSGGVAFAAHTGGLIAGAVLLPAIYPARPRRTYDRWEGFRNSSPR